MGTTCAKCGYERLLIESAPEHECPKCGVLYAYAEAASSLKKQNHPPSSPSVSDPSTITNDPETTSGIERLHTENSGLRNKTLVQAIIVAVVLAGAAYFGYTKWRGHGVEGQIFVVTGGRDNIRLGAVTVAAYRESEFEESIAKEKSEAQKMDAQFESELAAAENASLNEFQAFIDRKTDIYAKELLPKPKFSALSTIAITETDANGEFRLEQLQPGNYVLVAEASRQVLGKQEKENYQWMLHVDRTRMQKRILLNNSNMLGSGDCLFCIQPLLDSQTRRVRMAELYGAQKRLDARKKIIEAEREELRIKLAARIHEQNRIIEEKNRKEALERHRLAEKEIEELRNSIPDFDQSYRPPPGCQQDNPSMTQLLACGKARASAREEYDKKYAGARIKLKELQSNNRDIRY